MAVKVGMNGFGRIGRYLVRLMVDAKRSDLAVINARAENAVLAHLLKYDSIHGPFPGAVEATDTGLRICGKDVLVTRNNLGEYDWKSQGVDLVIETTGKMKDREAAQKHLDGGAKKVIVSAPCKGADLTVVMGVNNQTYDPAAHHVLSNASCTTNCLAPAAKTVNESFGIEHGLMTTVHSYTMDQRLLDGSHKDLRRGRAACLSMVPTTTGAAKAIGLVIPDLAGKLDGMSVRVPTPNVSLVDLVCQLKTDTSKDEVNAALKAAAEGPLKTHMGYCDEPLVSIDFKGSEVGGVVDSLCTSVINKRLLKLILWYDNESGFCWQLRRLLRQVTAAM